LFCFKRKQKIEAKQSKTYKLKIFRSKTKPENQMFYFAMNQSKTKRNLAKQNHYEAK